MHRCIPFIVANILLAPDTNTAAVSANFLYINEKSVSITAL